MKPANASFVSLAAMTITQSVPMAPATAQFPAYYIGSVVMLEAWRTGDVAFTGSDC